MNMQTTSQPPVNGISFIGALINFRFRLELRLNDYRQTMGYTFFDEYSLEVVETPKYYKVFKVQEKDNAPLFRDIVAFIDKKTGDILKPASYKVPAKHSRGNIFSPIFGMEAITNEGYVKYLK